MIEEKVVIKEIEILDCDDLKDMLELQVNSYEETLEDIERLIKIIKAMEETVGLMPPTEIKSSMREQIKRKKEKLIINKENKGIFEENIARILIMAKKKRCELKKLY